MSASGRFYWSDIVDIQQPVASARPSVRVGPGSSFVIRAIISLDGDSLPPRNT